MKEIDFVVIDAINGSAKAFEQLVQKYSTPLLSYIMAKGLQLDDAQDIVQESFVKAFCKLSQLNNPCAFRAWLYSIVRSVLSQYWRLLPVLQIEEPENIEAETAEKHWQNYDYALKRVLAQLKSEQSQVLKWHYFAGLSYKEMASLSGEDMSTIKSRLYEARKILRQRIPQYLLSEKEDEEFMMNKIFSDVEKQRLGAYILERLSLADQLQLAEAAANNEPFSENLLSRIGEIDKADAFIQTFHKQITFDEFVQFLNSVDSKVEARIIRTLDEKNPSLAKQLKDSMFVFEDFSLFDSEAMRLVLSKLDRPLLEQALAFAPKKLLDQILQALPDKAAAEALFDRIKKQDISLKDSEIAQKAMVDEAYKMDMAGHLFAKRVEKQGDAAMSITLSENGRKALLAAL